MTQKVARITFVGGPYDGSEGISQGPALLEQVDLPVSVNILRLLLGQEHGPRAAIRSVASYELVTTPDGTSFYEFRTFRAATAGEAADLEAWYRAMLVSLQAAGK